MRFLEGQGVDGDGDGADDADGLEDDLGGVVGVAEVGAGKSDHFTPWRVGEAGAAASSAAAAASTSAGSHFG